jgi:2-oxoglutarate ferredoxin oxidoreductase subunit alpha
MTPVMLLSDGYIANGSEPWRIPDLSELRPTVVTHPEAPDNGDEFQPYLHDERLSRPWAVPGTKGLMHRIGGLEKQDVTGNVSYDPENHHHMTLLRAQKVANIADDIPLQQLDGPDSGKLLVLSWGGPYGACLSASRKARAAGASVSHCHLRYLNPFPKNLGQIFERFDAVLVPELNMGQLAMMIRAAYGIETVCYNKVQGKPFSVGELVRKIEELLA